MSTFLLKSHIAKKIQITFIEKPQLKLSINKIVDISFSRDKAFQGIDVNQACHYTNITLLFLQSNGLMELILLFFNPFFYE